MKRLLSAILSRKPHHPERISDVPKCDEAIVAPTTLPRALDMLLPGGRLVNVLTGTADGDIERDKKGAQRRGFRKITFLINFERARESMGKLPTWLTVDWSAYLRSKCFRWSTQPKRIG